MGAFLILLGAPGAGKGTQAERLARELALPHVSTGDLFRSNVARGTGLGRRAQEFMQAGKLVPDELVLEMLFERTSAPDCGEGCVLDGFPRTLAQAEALERRLGHEDELRVCDLQVPEAVLVRRLVDRRGCRNCGNVHHLEFKAPRAQGQCDRCGGELVQRDDDRPEVVAERLEVYRRETRPLVEHYRAKGVLTEVDGDRPPDQVFESIRGWALATEALSWRRRSRSPWRPW